MRSFLKKAFITFVIAFLVGLGGIWGFTLLFPAPRALKEFRIVFENGDYRDLLGDYVKPEGPCNVIYVERKPVVYLCFPHMLLPRGTVAPRPEPSPESLPTPKNRSSIANGNGS
jgi:hypothetical protein